MGKKVKIGEIAKRANVRTSTIRYYVSQGLLPKPERVNKTMAYYDEVCVEKIRTISFLKETRHYPLNVIKTILSRMDQGVSLENAEAIENIVYDAKSQDENALLSRKDFLKQSGLTPEGLDEAEGLGLIMPFFDENQNRLYDQEDVRVAREVVRYYTEFFSDIGIKSEDLEFYVTLIKEIIEREGQIQHRLVSGKSLEQVINITMDSMRASEVFRTYLFKRLYQRHINQIAPKQKGLPTGEE